MSAHSGVPVSGGGLERFPIHSDDHRRFGLLSVPWSLVAPHEAQALRNHDQTLQRLAERGGLSLCELAAVLGDRKWRAMSDDEVRAFAATLPATPTAGQTPAAKGTER